MREWTVSVDEPESWAQALDGVPHGFDHTWACCRAASLNSGLPTYLYVAEQAGVRVVCPFSERFHGGFPDLVTPRGFSGFASNGDWEGFEDCWHAFATRRGAVCSYTAQHPAFGPVVRDWKASDSRRLYLLDLQAGAEATLARARKGRRRELRAWHLAGNQYITDRDALVAFALQQHSDFMQRVGAGAAARLTPPALTQLLTAPGTWLVGAGRPAEGITAVLLIGATRWGGEGVFNVGTLEGRAHTVALLAWGVQALAARGVPWFNLGGGVRDDDPIAAAKREWNPQAATLRRFKLIHRPALYRRLCLNAGVDADLTSDYFPAYRRPASA